jgi:hypothetical protein
MKPSHALTQPLTALASLGAGASGTTTTTLAALAATVVALVGVVLVTGRSLGSGPAAWIYSIGDMPLYRLLALVVIVGVAQVSFVAALMLATLFMAVSSLVPSLADVDTFLGSASRANFVPASTDSAAGPTLDQACAAKRAQPYGAFAVEGFANHDNEDNDHDNEEDNEEDNEHDEDNDHDNDHDNDKYKNEVVQDVQVVLKKGGIKTDSIHAPTGLEEKIGMH